MAKYATWLADSIKLRGEIAGSIEVAQALVALGHIREMTNPYARAGSYFAFRDRVLALSMPRERHTFAESGRDGKQRPSTREELVAWLNALADGVGVLDAPYRCTLESFGR